MMSEYHLHRFLIYVGTFWPSDRMLYIVLVALKENIGYES